MALGRYIKSGSYLNARVSALGLLRGVFSFSDKSESPEKDINSAWLLQDARYIFVDTDNGTASPTTPVHTSSTWPANTNRFNKLSTALANASVQAEVVPIIILCQGATDDNTAATISDSLSALEVTVIGNTYTPKFDTSKYYLNVAGGGSQVCTVSRTISNVTLKNLQFGSSGTATQRALNISSASGAYTISVDSCILNSGGTAVGGAALGLGTLSAPNIVKITNCILWSTTNLVSRSGFYENTSSGHGIYFYNNIVQGFNIGIERKASGGGTGHIYKNNIVFNNTDDFNTSTSGGMITAYNASDDGDGTNAITGVDWTKVFQDYVNNNYEAKAGNSLINAGIGPEADALVPGRDFMGTLRNGSTTDVGANEYAAASIIDVDKDNSFYPGETAIEVNGIALAATIDARIRYGSNTLAMQNYSPSKIPTFDAPALSSFFSSGMPLGTVSLEILKAV